MMYRDVVMDGLVVVDLGMEVVFPVNDSIESVVMVGGVVDSALGTVGFDEGVAAFDNVTVPGFVLALDVACVGVVNRVVEVVTGVGIVVVMVVVVMSVVSGCGVVSRPQFEVLRGAGEMMTRRDYAHHYGQNYYCQLKNRRGFVPSLSNLPTNGLF